MNLKKNVLVLVEHFGQGGAEKVAAMLTDMLAQSGKYKVHFYSVYNSEFSQSSNEVNKGTLGIEPATGITGKLLGYYQKVSRLRQLKKRLSVDLTISSLWPVDWMNALTGKEKKIAIIQINILGNDQNKNMVRFKKLVRGIYSKFDRIVLGSGNLAPEWVHYFGVDEKLLKVIHNPIDVKLIGKNLKADLPDTLHLLFDRYNVLVAANRLHPVKNTTALIPIIKGLTENPDIKLLIIGEGEEKPKLIAQIEKEGLHYSEISNSSFDESASIYFLKFQTNIHNIIGRAKLFLFPTKAEGLPLALLEAMYCGVPVIASDCPNGGMAEAMDAKYQAGIARDKPEFTGGGYLMPIPAIEDGKSIKIWIDTIKEVLNLDTLKLQLIESLNRNRAEQFDKHNIQVQWFGLIDDVFRKS